MISDLKEIIKIALMLFGWFSEARKHAKDAESDAHFSKQFREGLKKAKESHDTTDLERLFRG